MRPDRHQWYGKGYIAEYEKWIEYPEPRDEAVDRQLLYALWVLREDLDRGKRRH
jgi:hypothetical protein